MKKIIIIGIAILVLAGGVLGVIVIKNAKYKTFENEYEELVKLKSNLALEEQQKSAIEEELESLKQVIKEKASEKEIKIKKQSIKQKLEEIKNKTEIEIKEIEKKVKEIDKEKLTEEAKQVYDDSYKKYQELINSDKYHEAEEKINEILKTLEDSMQPKVMTTAFELVKNSTKHVDYLEGKFNANGTIRNKTNYSFSKVVINYDVICESGGTYKCADFSVTVKDVKPNETRNFNKTGYGSNLTAQYGGDKLKFKSIKAYK